MAPLATFVVLAMGLTSLIALACSVPQFVLGLLVAPIVKRANYLIEFLYPTSLVGWGHIALMRIGQKRNQGKNKSPQPHSRAKEQRIEVVPDRVYIHSIPFLLDNIAYLIVFLPQHVTPTKRTANMQATLQAYIVDCGDAPEVAAALSEISQAHYDGKDIVIKSILSTHKHHDHTAGNRMLKTTYCARTLDRIYGGAVERVPFCTNPLKDGDEVPVPDHAQDLVCIEAIAVPSHTRGSIIYALRTKPAPRRSVGTKESIHLFTGDAMFSGGGGVPFEADTEYRNPNKVLRPSAGTKSVERCFVEVLVRTGRLEPTSCAYIENALVYPGHEYTTNLLGAQLDSKSSESKFWSQLPPAVFFETASNFLVSNHRRALPRGTKLLTVPTPLTREFKVNAHFRSLIRRGEKLIQLVLAWRQYYKEDTHAYRSSYSSGKKTRSPTASNLNIVIRDSASIEDYVEREDTYARANTNISLSSAGSSNSCSTKSWTLTTTDIQRSVFTTLYTADLEDLIKELKASASKMDEDKKAKPISNKETAIRLLHMKRRLEKSVVTRRSVPDSLPSPEQMFQGAMALAILGAPPSAMTPSDAERMNLPKPVNDADYLLVSKTRVMQTLFYLGLIPDTTHCLESHAFSLLWEVAQCGDLSLEVENSHSLETGTPHQNSSSLSDVLDLGLLKYTLFGAIAKRKAPFWSSLCLPCSPPPSQVLPPLPPASKRRRRTGAELIRHDMQKCFMCKDVIGCPHLGHDEEKISTRARSSYSRLLEDDDTRTTEPLSDFLGNGVEIELFGPSTP